MRADPHCHTLASDGMVTPKELVEAALRAKLDLIAVTDHDTMHSVRDAIAWGEQLGLTVVPGQEITTKWPEQTHVLGWYLKKPVKRGMSLEDTIAAIHDQGALAVIPHPFMPTYFASIQPGALARLIEKTPIDGIEIEFTAPVGSRRRELLQSFFAQNSQRLGAAVGGSDCHFGAHDIAQVVTSYDSDFRTAVAQRNTSAQRVRHAGAPPAALAVRQQWRSLVELPLRRLRGQL